METTLKMKKKKTEMAGTKTLTDLPDNIIDEILCRLPITDAVRTCSLCLSWRRRWQSMPDLNLSGIRNRFASQTLTLHSGNIRLFKATGCDADESTLYWWLAALSARSGATLQTLHLDAFNCHLHSIARYFPNLTYLQLHRGFQYFSRDFSVFKSLHTLRLIDVTFYAHLSNLFSACPLLETANLIDIYLRERQRFDIDAPNLRYLELSDVENLIAYAITSAPVLKVLKVDWFDCDCVIDNDEAGGNIGDCRVMKVLRGMPNVEELHLSRSALEYFWDGKVPTRLPMSFDNIKFLSLGVNLESVSQSLLILCLLRSCPNLQKLECKDMWYDEEESQVGLDFWEGQEHFGIFDKLETLVMTYIEGAKAELGFIQFILAKAKMLKTLMVGFSIFDKKFIMSQLLGFPMISNQAQIIFKCRVAFMSMSIFLQHRLGPLRDWSMGDHVSGYVWTR